MVKGFREKLILLLGIHVFILSPLKADEDSPNRGKQKTKAQLENLEPKTLRCMIRNGSYHKPTNGCCSGYVQCNLIVLNKEFADDFEHFCELNKQACPLLEVCEEGSPYPQILASNADLRTDIPKYAIYIHGQKVNEVEDVTDIWPKDSVAFLIGCSFSYDAALQDAGIKLRSVEKGTNVPMYRSNIPCHGVGKLAGNMVVSMKPIKRKDLALEKEITAKYQFAHGEPVHVGDPSLIGIEDIDDPDWGDSVEVLSDEVPVFHACGVTPQLIVMQAGIPFAITHAPGHMFVTDTLCKQLMKKD